MQFPEMHRMLKVNNGFEKKCYKGCMLIKDTGYQMAFLVPFLQITKICF